MPTKVQAKGAVDAAATAIKADIDNILPVGSNITDGSISFQPLKWGIRMDAGGSSATGDSWLATITANLTTAGRTFIVRRGGRRSDDGPAKTIFIDTALAGYLIINIG